MPDSTNPVYSSDEEVALHHFRVPDSTNPVYSSDEEVALHHFRDTHQVLSDGRFSVALPRKSPMPILGESKSLAMRRFRQNESLAMKATLETFQSVLAEYGKLEHAELVPTNTIDLPSSEVYYLPVHGVSKESSTTTELRAVFDASAKSSTGCSLNDQLLAGPNLYPQLPSVLNRFRMFEIAMTSDISKMFREIVLQSSENNFHRFFQRNQNGHLEEWRMRHLTFCVKSSPFLATQVLRQSATNQ